MATQKLGLPDKPERISDYLRTRLCAQWAALDAERLKLNEAARAKAKRQAEIEALLTGQLQIDGALICDLARWQFGLELVAGSLSYKDELVKVIGDEELQKLKAAAPEREKFFLRDKGRAKPAAMSKRKAA